MRRSELFVEPSRQSQWAIVFIILRFLKGFLRQLWPIALAVYLGRNSSFDRYEMIFSGLGIFGMISSVIAYYKYYFYVSDQELVIRSGLIKKVHLNIPFERIQSVNFKQTVLHQFFRVTELEIETAGSKDQETRLDALTMDRAEALRKLLLEKRAAALSINQTDEQDAKIFNVLEEELPREPILELSIEQLIKVGLTQNHLAPIGIVLGLMFSAMVYGFTMDLNPIDYLRSVVSYGEELSILHYVLIGIAVLILSVLFSVITTLLRHYNLDFWRQGEKFQVVQGLLTRREFAALDNKIQILNWGQNPLERWIGFLNIIFRQAKSGDGRKSNVKFVIPGCSKDQVEFVKEQWLDKKVAEFENKKTVSIHYFLRFAIYFVSFFTLIAVLNAYLGNWPVFAGIVLFVVLGVVFRWIKYKKLKYAFNGDEVYIGGGVIGLRHSLLPAFKIQNLSIQQNPYQWRRDLATLVIDTAAGRIKIPYIAEIEAQALLDKYIYKVETSRKPWM